MASRRLQTPQQADSPSAAQTAPRARRGDRQRLQRLRCVADAAGLLTASEADHHARAVKQCIKLRESAAQRDEDGSLLVVGRAAIQQLRSGSIRVLLLTEPDAVPPGASSWWHCCHTEPHTYRLYCRFGKGRSANCPPATGHAEGCWARVCARSGQTYSVSADAFLLPIAHITHAQAAWRLP